MLYGVRPQLQLELVRRGYKVLVATPYGPEWYPYLMRRLAERPANLLFVAEEPRPALIRRRAALRRGGARQPAAGRATRRSPRRRRLRGRVVDVVGGEEPPLGARAPGAGRVS